MPEFDLHFSPSSSTDSASFKLIELPKDLCALIESASDNNAPLSLTIKGQHGEDAVICTHNTTFTMKAVSLSNSVLVVTSPPDASSVDFPDDAVVICDQVNEIIELAPSVPKLHTLSSILRGRDYDDGQQDEYTQETNTNVFTYEEALQKIQASDTELDQGLKNRHILNIAGELRPIAPDYLNRLLELILNVLVSLSLSPESVSVEVLLSTLADEHEIPRNVSTQVMSWFGDISQGKWAMDRVKLVKQVGLGVLRPHLHETIRKDELIAKWKSIVGDTFETDVHLGLLSGNYIIPLHDGDSLLYFPSSSLPVEAAARFADLFLTRPRWRAQDITPFLSDIALDGKERDKLLLKYGRAATDAEGVWYTARVTT